MNNTDSCELQVRSLNVDEAQSWFEQMPISLQITSLSPAFAVADAQRDHSLVPFHCGIEKGVQRWLTSVHAMPFSVNGAKGLISPYGYGGPLTHNATPEFNRKAFVAWQQYCRQQGWLVEVVRFHPMAEESVAAFRDVAQENRLTVVVDLALDEVMAQYNNSARSKVRTCLKSGVVARWSQHSEDWMAFGDFYRQAMRELNADSKYEFTDTYFDAIRKIPAAQLCICDVQGTDNKIGDSTSWLSASVYLFGPQVVEYHLSASSDAGRKLGSAALAQHAAALRGKHLGAKWLYLGGGTDSTPGNRLLFFKRCFSKDTRIFHVAKIIHAPDKYAELLTKAGYSSSKQPDQFIF